jgi:hypothetical protein
MQTDSTSSDFSKLIAVDQDGYNEAWQTLFLNPAKVRSLGDLSDKNAAGALLAAGRTWTGTGWNTGKASKELHRITGVPLVSGTFAHYMGAFLFSLAMWFGLEIDSLDLSERAAEAAFALVQCYQEDIPGKDSETAHIQPVLEDEPREEFQMEWDEPEENLAPELAYLFGAVSRGERRLEMRDVLQQFPRFADLPTKPPENNHRGDKVGSLDKERRILQQAFLHTLRMNASIYMGLNSNLETALLQIWLKQMFTFNCEQYQRLMNLRKEASIPGSVVAQDVAGVLFDKEDLQQAQLVQKVNGAGNQRFKGFGKRTQIQQWGKAYSPKGGRFRSWGAGTDSIAGQRLPYSSSSGRGFKGGHGYGSQFPSSSGGPGYGSYSGRGKGKQGVFAPSVTNLRSFFSSQAEKPDGMVAAECAVTSGGVAAGRCRLVMRSSSLPPRFPLRQAPARSASLQGIGGRIPAGRSNQGARQQGAARQPCSQVFGALASAYQVGRRCAQTQADFGLQSPECLFGSSALQAGSLGTDFPLCQKGDVGSQAGPQACLFSSPRCRGNEAVSVLQSGRASLSIPSRLLRAVDPSISVDECHEGLSKTLAGEGHSMLHLPGRHFGPWTNSRSHFGKHGFHFGNSGPFGHDDEYKKEYSGTHPKVGAFGVSIGFEDGKIVGASSKVKNLPQGIGQVGNPSQSELSENGRHFGPSAKFSHSHALFTGVYRQDVKFCAPKSTPGVGQSIGGSSRVENGNFASRSIDAFMARLRFSGSLHCAQAGFRQFRPGMGRSGFTKWTLGSGFLEGQLKVAHQRQGVGGCRGHGEKFGETKGSSLSQCGQFSGLRISPQGRGSVAPLECPHAKPLGVVHGQGHYLGTRIGQVLGAKGGPIEPSFGGPRGLCFGPSVVPILPKALHAVCPPSSGHVCQPKQSATPQVLLPPPSLGGLNGGRLALSLARGGLLCQPSVASHSSMAQPVEGTPSSHLHGSRPLLGFCNLVAPTSETARASESVSGHSTFSRDVSKLLGATHATPKVAPPLHNIIRSLLQRRQVSDEGIQAYLSKCKALPRYDNAFNALWHRCSQHNVVLLDASLDVIASELLLLHQVSPPQARHAYSALLWLPGFDQLRFSPLLASVRREWNHNQAKYSNFWDAASFLQTVSQQPLDWTSTKEVRDRLIICWRLLGLHRSIDLARLQRCVSFVGTTPFVLLQRKGWQKPRWEEVMVLPEFPTICPWTLLRHYVELTRNLVTPGQGTFVLRALCAPFAPVCADTVGSITRRILETGGVNTRAWGPHSTRGAAVRMFKDMGLSSEHVCELGQWKNVAAFTSHYLRLGAQQVAARRVIDLVHTVSPRCSAEPERPRTPTRKPELGGRGLEGEAPSLGEPTPPPLVIPSPSTCEQLPLRGKLFRVGRKRKLLSPLPVPNTFQFKRPRPAAPTADIAKQ